MQWVAALIYMHIRCHNTKCAANWHAILACRQHAICMPCTCNKYTVELLQHIICMHLHTCGTNVCNAQPHSTHPHTAFLRKCKQVEWGEDTCGALQIEDKQSLFPVRQCPLRCMRKHWVADFCKGLPELGFRVW